MAPDGPVLFQFAYLVDDLEAAADHWATTFGAGPFFVTPHHRPTGSTTEGRWSRPT